MKMLGKVFVKARILLMAVLLPVLFVPTVVNADDTIEKLRESVVRVICEAGGGRVGTGSGFVIGTGMPTEYVVTNWHVVEPNPQKVSLFLSRDLIIKAEVVKGFPVKDMAILRVVEPLHNRPPVTFANFKDVKVGQRVLALGFPGSADFMSDAFSGKPTDVTVTNGIISKRTTLNGVEVFQTDAPINPGNSGGPLVNENGEIVGINSFTMLDAKGINGSYNLQELVDDLNTLGIKYKQVNVTSDDNKTQAAPASAPAAASTSSASSANTNSDSQNNNAAKGKSSNTLFILLLVGGLLVVGGGVAVAIVLSQKGKNQPAQSAQSPYNPQYQQIQQPQPMGQLPMNTQAQMPMQGQSQMTMRAPVQSSSTMAMQQDKTMPLMSSRPILCGVSGFFNGNCLELSNGQVTIGRDPQSCQLVFPDSSNEISRRHCNISFDPSTQTFMLKDSSSNGTFLYSGERLMGDRPYHLKSGDRFYLSENKNMFEVRMEKR